MKPSVRKFVAAGLLGWCSLGTAGPAALSVKTAADSKNSFKSVNVEPQLPVLNWEKCSDWINVKTDVTPVAFGDGTHDDTAAIQAALNLLRTNLSYSTVYMPPGTYRITDTLRLTQRHGAAWIGHGRNTRIVWDGPTNSVHGMYWSDGVGYCRYVGMILDGAGKATIGHDHCSTTYFETRVRYQHMAFVNFSSAGVNTGSGLRSNNSAETLFENCIFTNCALGANVYHFNQYNYTFTGCEFRDCGQGLNFGWGSNGRVWDSHFERNALDIRFAGEHGGSARRCTSVGSGQFASQVGVAPITIQDCQVSGWTNANYAIHLGGCPAMIFDCVFTNPPSTNAPIALDGGHLIVSSNRSYNTTGVMAVGPYPSVTEIPAGLRGGAITSATQTFFRSEARIPGKVFDVKRDFGAKGDLSVDDTEAITRAIEAARNHGRGAIAYFPAGNYKVTSTIPVSGSDYFVGGTVGFEYAAARICAYQSTGVVFAVRDPRNVTMQHIFVDPTNKIGVCAIQQTSSGGKSHMVYDGVHVPGTYCTTDPRPRGLELIGLGKGDVVDIPFIEGEMRFVNCGRASVLVRSWIDGQVMVEGTEQTRDGFLGFLFAHTTSTSTYGVTVSNNQSLAIGDYYQEQSQKNLLLCGAPGEPEGRVTVQGDKVNCYTNPVIMVQNYQGRLCFGHDMFYGNSFQPAISQTGERPVKMVFMANVSFASPANPVFYLNTNAAQLTLIENNWTNNVIPDGGLQAAAYGLDHLRELGQMDIKMHYTTPETKWSSK